MSEVGHNTEEEEEKGGDKRPRQGLLTLHGVGVTLQADGEDFGVSLGRGEVRLTDPLVALEEHLRVLEGRELKHRTPLVGSWWVPVVKHLGKKGDTRKDTNVTAGKE